VSGGEIRYSPLVMAVRLCVSLDRVGSAMRSWWCLGVWLAAGCSAMPASEGFLPPDHPVAPPRDASEIVVDDPEEAPAEAAPSDEDDDDGAAAVEPEDELTDAQLLALAQGIDPATVVEPEPEPEPMATPAPVAEASGLGSALGDLGFGVRVVAVLMHTQPPRAILGLPSGAELVVEPGSFVDEARLVVLAVGTEGVQVAHVLPHGDRTKVSTEVLQPLHRSERTVELR
jgi:hypothetical protein